MSDALIHLRVPVELKARWVRESRAQGLRLTDWIAQRVERKEQKMQINFSEKFVAIPNIGGILTDLASEHSNPRALRVSQRLATEYERPARRAQWVVVQLPDGQAAITVQEAIENQLSEVEWRK